MTAQFPPIDLDGIAARCRSWQDRNFNPSRVQAALALCEEAGEVARAVLKTSHGIRSATRGDVGDEIGDVLLTAIALAHRHGLSSAECLDRRFRRLSSIDFAKYPETGRAPDPRVTVTGTLSGPPPCVVCKSEDHGHVTIGVGTFACPGGAISTGGELADRANSQGFSIGVAERRRVAAGDNVPKNIVPDDEEGRT